MSTNTLSETQVEYPYPGLRPFLREEAEIFFGREEHVIDLATLLEDYNFVAVVGPSGCGKSSLVKAGLIPKLEMGIIKKAGFRWHVAEMRPGKEPLENLTAALLNSSLFEEAPPNPAFLEATLRRGPLGLVEVLSKTSIAHGHNLLVLVDQFEEIFRYEDESQPGEASKFVNLLLASAAASRDSGLPLHVVLTMRSDFLGRCPIFPGLPEAMNRCQFLTPRLKRDEIRSAVEAPAGMFDAEVAADVVSRVVNAMGDDPDQLPLMQHLLQQMWLNASGPEGASGERRADAEGVPQTGKILTLGHYLRAGGLSDALSKHADGVFESLPADEQRIAEIMFRRLAQYAPNDLETRCLATVSDIAAIADVDVSAVMAVADVFRVEGRSFLVLTEASAPDEQSFLDISHESLIRQWKRLKEWVKEEDEVAQEYRRLEERARIWKSGNAALLREADLDRAVAWRIEYKPSQPWAKRYGGDFARCMEFLDKSVEDRDLKNAEARRREITRQRNKLLAFIAVALVAIVMTGLFLWALIQGNRAQIAVKEKEELNAGLEEKNNDLIETIAEKAAALAEAERQTRIAKAHRIAVQADDELTSSPVQSTIIAAEAVKPIAALPARVPFVEQTLRDALANCQGYGLGGHVGRTRHVQFSPLARWVVTTSYGDDDHLVRLWDLRAQDPSRTAIRLADHQAGINALAFAPDERWLATADDNEIHLRAIQAEMPFPQPHVLTGPREPVSLMTFSADGRWLMAACAESLFEKRIHLWDVSADAPRGPVILESPESIGYLQDIRFRDSGKTLVAAFSNDVAVWSLELKDPAAALATVWQPGGLKMRISPLGNWLLVNVGPGRHQLLDLTKKDPLEAPLAIPGDWESLSFSPNEHWLVGHTDKTASAWNLITREPATCWDTKQKIITAIVSSDSQYLIAASQDSITVAAMEDATEPSHSIAIDTGTGSSLTDVAITPDSAWIVCTRDDNAVLLRRLAYQDSTEFVLCGQNDRSSSFQISSDSRWMVTVGGNEAARLWDLNEPESSSTVQVIRGQGGARVKSVAVGGPWLITADSNGEAQLYAAQTDGFGFAAQLPCPDVASISISGDGRRAITASHDNTVKAWDLNAENKSDPIATLDHQAPITALDTGPAGRWVITLTAAGDGRLWDLTAADQTTASRQLNRQDEVLSLSAISPDGRWLATANNEGDVSLWDVSSAEAASDPLRTAPSPSQGQSRGPRRLTTLTFSADSHWLFAGSIDGSLLGWDVTNELALATSNHQAHSGSEITAMAVSHDNRWLATASRDMTTCLWQLGTSLDSKRPIALPGHESYVTDVAFSSDGRWLVTGGIDMVARLWDLDSQELPQSAVALRGHERAIRSVSVTSDSRWIVTASEDGTVRLWTPDANRLLQRARQAAGRNLAQNEFDKVYPGEDYHKTFDDLP